jgi:putative phosphoribosyl transferase
LPGRPDTISVGGTDLHADVVVPDGAAGAVLFAHGSGSSRRSPRNRQVAAALNAAGLATVLVDLLTEQEEQRDARTRHLRFDIDLLSSRLLEVVAWLRSGPSTSGLALGAFGASTGAGAALEAAADQPAILRAVVSRGGRPDLAGDRLTSVLAPTLLIVGSLDHAVLELNRRALDRLAGVKELAVVPGASHLFEEPGTLEEVARLASGWFLRHLGAGATFTPKG